MAIQRIQTPAGEAQLRELVETHVEQTGSKRGKAILDDWQTSLGRFWQLVPPSESATPEASKRVAEMLAGKGATSPQPVGAAA